jgi:hypothetical protein
MKKKVYFAADLQINEIPDYSTFRNFSPVHKVLLGYGEKSF